MAGAVEGDAGARLGLAKTCGTCEGDGEDGRSCGSGENVGPQVGDDRREGRAAGEACRGGVAVHGRSCGFHTVVRSVAAAAGAEVGLRPRRQAKRGRNRRQTEGEHQQQAEKAAQIHHCAEFSISWGLSWDWMPTAGAVLQLCAHSGGRLDRRELWGRIFLTRVRDNGDGHGVQAGCEEPCAVSSAFLAIAP